MKCAEITEHLSQYLDGELSPERHRDIARHLSQCERCCNLCEDFKTLDERLRCCGKAAATVDDAPPPTARLADKCTGSDEIMTIRTLADYLHLTIADVRRLLPQLPYIDLCGNLRFRKSDIQAWLADRTHREVPRGIVSTVKY